MHPSRLRTRGQEYVSIPLTVPVCFRTFDDINEPSNHSAHAILKFHSPVSAEKTAMTEQGLKLTALGKYTLIASLAEGGMAKVYLGLMAGPAGFNKLLVIKVLNRDEQAHREDDSVQLFWDEARLAARVIHPNVVHTYEVGEVEGRYFLAMEYLDGQSYRALQNRIPKTGLPPCEELRIISETARGLHYAHQLRDFNGEPLGVVHRDVSPQNVFITYEGQVKLLDFGIAKSYDAGHKTQNGVIRGKLDYMAPEQLSGDKVDARTDVFALGVMLWEAVSGKRFAGGRSVPEIRKVHARLTGAEAKLRDVAPDVPEELVAIVERGIAVDPQRRWPDAGAMADALDAYIASTGHRPGAKSLSDAMNGLFAEERLAMHKVIQQQIESNADRPLTATTGMLPRLETGQTLTPASGRDVAMHVASGTNSSPTVADTPKVVSSQPRFIVAVVAGVAAAAFALFPSTPDQPKPVATMVAPASTMQETPVPRGPERSDIPTAIAPSPRNVDAKDESMIAISLRAVPSDARVTLDGAEVTLPFTVKFPQGSEAHRVEATAKGYEPYRKLISFSGDQSLDIVLEPIEQDKPRRGGGKTEERTSQAQAAKAPVPATATPTAKLAPGAILDIAQPIADTTDIDTTNPFGRK